MKNSLVFLESEDIGRTMLLKYALNNVTIKGLHLEFGVWSGSSINFCAVRKPTQTFYGFDSFEGLPEDWSGSSSAKGCFLVDALPKVEDNVVLIKGWFNETLPTFAKEHTEPVAFLHIDCDLYSSTKTVFDTIGGQIVPGTMIMFDEYFNYPTWENHEFKAFQEFVTQRKVKYTYLAYGYFQVVVRIDSIG